MVASWRSSLAASSCSDSSGSEAHDDSMTGVDGVGDDDGHSLAPGRTDQYDHNVMAWRLRTGAAEERLPFALELTAHQRTCLS